MEINLANISIYALCMSMYVCITLGQMGQMSQVCTVCMLSMYVCTVYVQMYVCECIASLNA